MASGVTVYRRPDSAQWAWDEDKPGKAAGFVMEMEMALPSGPSPGIAATPTPIFQTRRVHRRLRGMNSGVLNSDSFRGTREKP